MQKKKSWNLSNEYELQMLQRMGSLPGHSDPRHGIAFGNAAAQEWKNGKKIKH